VNREERRRQCGAQRAEQRAGDPLVGRGERLRQRRGCVVGSSLGERQQPFGCRQQRIRRRMRLDEATHHPLADLGRRDLGRQRSLDEAQHVGEHETGVGRRPEGDRCIERTPRVLELAARGGYLQPQP
jgi:hypothetical protein